MKLSVVMPVYNEEILVVETIRQVVHYIESLEISYEIIVINDGSSDNTLIELKQIKNEISKLIILNLTRNFGQHPSILAGLIQARGEFVIIMDADMQDNPRAIPSMWVAAQLGHDIVQIKRSVRKSGLFYMILQTIFYKLFNMLTDTKLDSKIGNFSLLSKKAVDLLLQVNRGFYFFPAAVNWIGLPRHIIDYEQSERKQGTTVYNFSRRLSLAIKIILMHSSKALNLSIFLGFFVSTLSCIYGVYVLATYLGGNVLISGWTSIALLLTFFSGVQLFFMGVVGIYLNQTFSLTKNLPSFLIKEIID